MATIDLTGVRKRFGETEIVRGVDLTVPSGAFLSLLGPSGCGKTTLLRMLAGLEQPSEGDIRIDGAVVNGVAPGARDIAMVFQSYALYPQMTVAQNIAYPLRKRGVPRGERATRVAAVAEMLKLEALLDRKPRQLSGGQQQRVALGRALVREPRIFLLDEPLSNLDATLRSHMRAELVELHRRIGRTMVYVTHDQLEAMTMSTHIAVIDGGVVQQFGTPAEIYRRPANRMVAAFIGTPAMAFVDAAIEGGALMLAGQAVAAAEGASGPVVLGIRAEDVRIDHGGGVPATVTMVEPVGHETLVRLECSAGIVTTRMAGDADVRPGERLGFSVTPANLHFFDRSSGERLPVTATALPDGRAQQGTN
jgi:multiple sugar transport system ATP-binding protein